MCNLYLKHTSLLYVFHKITEKCGVRQGPECDVEFKSYHSWLPLHTLLKIVWFVQSVLLFYTRVKVGKFHPRTGHEGPKKEYRYSGGAVG